MERPQAGLDLSLELTSTGGDRPGSADGPRRLVEAAQLARWESEGGALREPEQRTS
jgi:hypothetical protein